MYVSILYGAGQLSYHVGTIHLALVVSTYLKVKDVSCIYSESYLIFLQLSL